MCVCVYTLKCCRTLHPLPSLAITLPATSPESTVSSSCPATQNKFLCYPANHTQAEPKEWQCLFSSTSSLGNYRGHTHPVNLAMFPVPPSPCPWSPPVTNGYKHISDIPGHPLLDGVLHVIVGHLDELLEDWPQEKPRRWEVSFDSEEGGKITPPQPTQQQQVWLQPRPKCIGQDCYGSDVLTSGLP